MKKIFIISTAFIISMLILMNSKCINALAESGVENQNFVLTIIENEEEIYSNSEECVVKKYNTLMLPMEAVFCRIFQEYEQEATRQTLVYKDNTMEIDKEKNIIRIPNFYNVNSTRINDSIDIEIEEIEGIKYIPIYLISSLSGVDISIDGKIIYDENNYCNSTEVLKNNNLEHIIVIRINEYGEEKKEMLWNEEALKRIEKYRKNDIDFIVENQYGKVIENAEIDLNMNNNEFKFGTSVRKVETTGINKYTSITRNLFNAIGSENGFKWPLLASNGNYIPEDVIEYSQKNNMYLRGHNLWTDRLWGDTNILVGDIENPKEDTMSYIYSKYNSGEISAEEAEELINNIRINFENIVLRHIQDEVQEFPEVQEWDVINEAISQQYFKYYLYDKNMLIDRNFLTTSIKNMNEYTDNEEYYQFLAKCFDETKKCNSNAKLVLNNGIIDGSVSSSNTLGTIRVINKIRQYTNNISALGIQYHVNNRYYFTPQSYYNQINYVLEQTGLKEAIITEYDNYTKDKLNKYTKEEREQKANYLRDTLIAQYSNPNVSGFNFWVYNSGTGSFVEEEWQVYEELMKEWLNDEQSGKTDSNGNYSTRLYKGEYTAKVKINNLEKEVPIRVSDNAEPVEIIINSNLEKISVKQKPNKTEYIQEKESFDADGGVILAHYDDGTVKEIDMSSGEVEISKLDNSILGKQTITVTYKDKKVTFVVDVIEQSGKSPVVGANEEITDISIVKLPERVEYIQNKERINLKAGKLLIKYKDGTTKEISMDDKDVSISGFDNSILGEKAIRVTYKGKETTFVVSIVEDTSKSDDTIANKNLPNAGMQITILTVIIILVIIAIVSGKKYIQYLKDTYKQIK